MKHDPNFTALGTTRSSVKDVGNHHGLIDAGKLVRLKSDGTISTAKADGLPRGVSLGIDQSAAGYTAVAYAGIDVPILLTTGFTPTLGTIVHVDDTTGMAAASATDASAVNATFTGLLSNGALAENGSSTCAAAFISFPIGL